MDASLYVNKAFLNSAAKLNGDQWYAYRLTVDEMNIVLDCVKEQIQSAILAEREACAKICDSTGKRPDDYSSDFLAIGDIYAAQIRARSNAPETEKEIIVRMPPKSRQAGFFTINDYQTLDPGENVALDPVSA